MQKTTHLHFSRVLRCLARRPPPMKRQKRKLDPDELADAAARDHAAAIVERFWTACRTRQLAEVERLLASGIVTCTTVCMPGKMKTIFDHAFIYRSEHREVLALLLRHTPGPLDRGLIVTLLRKWAPDMTASLRLLMQRQSFSMEAESGALHLIPQPPDAALIAALAEGGADLNSRDRDGLTPLYIAVKGDYIVAVRALLSHGADPDIPDALGVPPLFVAQSPRVIKALLTAGADLHARGPGNDTALHYMIAAESCQLNCITTLLDAGADVRATNWAAETPLVVCTKRGRSVHWTEAVPLLLSYGADPHARDLDRKTAYMEFVSHVWSVMERHSVDLLAQTSLAVLGLFAAYGVTRRDYTHDNIDEFTEFLTDALPEGLEFWTEAKAFHRHKIP